MRKMAPIRIAGLVDWQGFKDQSENQQKKTKHERGFSKSGLDWEQEDDKEAPKNWEEMAEDKNKPLRLVDLIREYGLEEEDEDDPMSPVEERDLKALIKSIHKHAADLYNKLDEMDEPEEWVMEKAKDCAAKIAEIHSHIDYNKNKAEELPTEPTPVQSERGY